MKDEGLVAVVTKSLVRMRHSMVLEGAIDFLSVIVELDNVASCARLNLKSQLSRAAVS